jgi:transcriptional regulator with XRE-family HTH domain
VKNLGPAQILATYLKEAREKSGRTQKQVSDLLGYSSAQFVSAWERAEREPPMNVIWTLAGLYELTPESLFDTMLAYRTSTLQSQLRADFLAARPKKN